MILSASFSTLCSIRLDLREAAKTLTPITKISGQEGFCYVLKVDVIISFGSTEFTAQVAWEVDVSFQELSPFFVFSDVIMILSGRRDEVWHAPVTLFIY